MHARSTNFFFWIGMSKRSKTVKIRLHRNKIRNPSISFRKIPKCWAAAKANAQGHAFSFHTRGGDRSYVIQVSVLNPCCFHFSRRGATCQPDARYTHNLMWLCSRHLEPWFTGGVDNLIPYHVTHQRLIIINVCKTAHTDRVTQCMGPKQDVFGTTTEQQQAGDVSWLKSAYDGAWVEANLLTCKAVLATVSMQQAYTWNKAWHVLN